MDADATGLSLISWNFSFPISSSIIWCAFWLLNSCVWSWSLDSSSVYLRGIMSGLSASICPNLMKVVPSSSSVFLSVSGAGCFCLRAFSRCESGRCLTAFMCVSRCPAPFLTIIWRISSNLSRFSSSRFGFLTCTFVWGSEYESFEYSLVRKWVKGFG